MPFTIEDLLTPDRIHLDVSASSKKQALQMLSRHLAEGANDANADEIFEALVERERLGCTAADFGLAVPHARLAAVRNVRGALLRLDEAIDFDSADERDVDLIFGFVIPATEDEARADALRRLMQHLVDPALARTLRDARDPDSIITAIATGDGRPSVALRDAAAD